MDLNRYDYIIAGAGASGLSLAYGLNRAGLGGKRILLIDREPKTLNDRTWCFWEHGENPFEQIVYKRWQNLAFYGEGFSKVFGIAPYAYKMIRGIDFYQFMDNWLSEQPNIQRVYREVESIQGQQVQAGGQSYTADWIFNSIPATPPKLPQYQYLLQHFKGWVIGTAKPFFDASTATFMDFRVEQHGDVRFAYVLPFDANSALVEYTLFSAELLPQETYDQELQGYIRDWLQLPDYQVTHQEFGVIPMTDAPFPPGAGERVVNIGTAGGRTKPSTGYTFLRIQKQCRQIARALAEGKSPLQASSGGRFAFYDSVFLNVLAKQRYPGCKAFGDLFRRSPAQMVLKFLDEATSPLEELRVLLSMNVPVFTLAALDVIGSRLRP